MCRLTLAYASTYINGYIYTCISAMMADFCPKDFNRDGVMSIRGMGSASSTLPLQQVTNITIKLLFADDTTWNTNHEQVNMQINYYNNNYNSIVVQMATYVTNLEDGTANVWELHRDKHHLEISDPWKFIRNNRIISALIGLVACTSGIVVLICFIKRCSKRGSAPTNTTNNMVVTLPSDWGNGLPSFLPNANFRKSKSDNSLAIQMLE